MRADILLKAVADKTRINILAYLRGGPKFVEQIAMQLNIGVSTASFHLEKLKAAGLVRVKKDQYYKIYSLTDNALDINLGELIFSCGVNDKDEFISSVKKEYKNKKKIEKLPVQKMKRAVVLKELCSDLKNGVAYSEREINIHIADRIDDFVTARKEMVLLNVIEKKGDYFYKK